ncbi:unnamed protein product [Kluyveromyces dobzhanskii CBS 2104]|uniref:Carboxylic ester hydrolase n=1 Tax=Kluyveromyces dobzhanskii CBS 2104 TaxID=1427455 RepID=A0A0A8L6H6_9SACH|nr:unnamed protein product [Kluyveromyces dobzhanskii CBS 2104]
MGQVISTENAAPHKLSIPGQGVLTGYTLKSGRTNNSTVHRFAQVPFAEKFTNENRFKRPVPLSKDYDYTGDYRDFGLKCPQPPVDIPSFRYPKSPSDESINKLNIWVPSSDKFKGPDGWPVLIYIHGGWLQYSSPYTEFFNPNEAFDDEEFDQKYILVTPGYRLNMFGFLSANELLEEDEFSSNFGFWDQRLAIEWTYQNIRHFGGNPEQISVGGLSAGAYSTFFQLAYELYHPQEPQIIKQVLYFSNLVYVQPKTIEETQNQFDEVIEKLNVDPKASSQEKLAALRALDPSFIEDLILTLNHHTFRAVTDDKFISSTLIKDLDSGEYAKKLLAIKGDKFRILCGEVNNECYKYSLLNTPRTIEELPVQVNNYYPKKLADTLLDLYEAEKLDPNSDTLKEDLRIKYGEIIGDGQVYASGRGYLSKLVEHGFPSSNIFRYRVSYRAKWLDEHIKPELKVPHAGDFTVWFYCLREGYTEEERIHINKWLKPYLQFLNFQTVDSWSSDDIEKFKHFKEDGSSDYVDDEDWEWGVKVANLAYKSQLPA